MDLQAQTLAETEPAEPAESDEFAALTQGRATIVCETLHIAVAVDLS